MNFMFFLTPTTGGNVLLVIGREECSGHILKASSKNRQDQSVTACLCTQLPLPTTFGHKWRRMIFNDKTVYVSAKVHVGREGFNAVCFHSDSCFTLKSVESMPIQEEWSPSPRVISTFPNPQLQALHVVQPAIELSESPDGARVAQGSAERAMSDITRKAIRDHTLMDSIEPTPLSFNSSSSEQAVIMETL